MLAIALGRDRSLELLVLVPLRRLRLLVAVVRGRISALDGNPASVRLGVFGALNETRSVALRVSSSWLVPRSLYEAPAR